MSVPNVLTYRGGQLPGFAASESESGLVRLATAAEARGSANVPAVRTNTQLWDFYSTNQELTINAALGFLSVVSRYAPAAVLSPTSGAVYFVPFVGVAGTVTGIRGHGSGAASGLTLCKMGIYLAPNWVDGQTPNYSAATLVAQTTSNTTWGANGTWDTALAANYAMVPGAKYFVAVLQVGTTPATIRGAGVPDGLSRAVAPQMCMQLEGQTDLPANMGSPTTTSFGINQPRLHLVLSS